MGKLAIICSGQGSQQTDLIQRLTKYPEAASLLTKLRPSLPAKVEAWLEQPENEGLFTDEICQPLICLSQMLTWEIIKKNCPPPGVFMGYSLGELGAYGCSGAYQQADVLAIAAKRAAFMTRAGRDNPSGLAAVKGLSIKTVSEICERHEGYLAIVDGEDHFVVGTNLTQIQGLLKELEQNGAQKVVQLHVSIASHTPYMDQAADELRKLLPNYQYTPILPLLLSGVSGEPVYSPKQTEQALADLTNHTLRFDLLLKQALDRGCRVFLELGPGRSLSHIVLENYPDLEARSVEEFSDLQKVGAWALAALGRQD